jgi:hypothetical protein
MENVESPHPLPLLSGVGDIIKDIWGRKRASYRGRNRLSETYQTVNDLWDEFIAPTNRQLIPSDQLTDSDRLLLISHVANPDILKAVNWDKQKLNVETYNHFLKNENRAALENYLGNKINPTWMISKSKVTLDNIIAELTNNGTLQPFVDNDPVSVEFCKKLSKYSQDTSIIEGFKAVNFVTEGGLDIPIFSVSDADIPIFSGIDAKGGILQFFQSNLNHVVVKTPREIETINCRPSIEHVGKISICSDFINDYIIGSILGSNPWFGQFFITYYAGIFCKERPYIFMERLDGPVSNHKEILPRENEYEEALDLAYIIFQTTYALIQAYYNKGFEHNDIHSGNIMIKKTNNPQTVYLLDGQQYDLPNRGFHVVIIDFGFSSIKINNDVTIQSDQIEKAEHFNLFRFFMDIYLINSFVQKYWEKSNIVPETTPENLLEFHNNLSYPTASHEILLAESYNFIQSITY